MECRSSIRRETKKEKIANIITELRAHYRLSILLKIAKMKRSTYYYTISKKDKDEENDSLMNEIIAIFYEHKSRYGYRRITLELKNRGYSVNHKKVKRLMFRMELYGVTPKAKYKSYKGDMNGTCKNLLLNKIVDEENHKTYYERDFSTSRCNEKWSTDVSEFHIATGKLYLSPIIDLHNREIVSYDISTSPNYKQIQNMLSYAFKKHQSLTNLIFQSDQGWQYQMPQYHKTLSEMGITQSMSRKGNCLDNSIMENFFGVMKREMFYGHEYEFTSLDQLEFEMRKYISYYNNNRITQKLKGLTPVQYRNQSLTSC